MISITAFVAEVIGTFIFMLAIVDMAFGKTHTSFGGAGMTALLIGLGLAVSIYITSGLGGYGHLNPVATGVCALNGQVGATDALLLILGQIVGAGAAFIVYYYMTGTAGKTLPTVL